MRFARILVLPLGALMLAACGMDDSPTVNARPPLAGVRFIHAIPDEGIVDVRMIDQVAWSSYALGINFRQGWIHMPTEAKARRIRVFRAGNTIDVVGQVLIDTTITFAANTNYTAILTGSVAAGTQRIHVIEDVPLTISDGQIAIRAVNTTGAATNAAITPTTASPFPGTPTWANIAPLTATSYELRATGAFAVQFSPGASGTAPPGAPEADGIGATAGSSAGGSALAAYLFPASVAGANSRAPQTAAFTTPAVIFFVDRVPTPPLN